MLDKQHRFHGHGSLRFVYRHGKPTRNRFLMLRSTANPKRTHSRMAVVVAKKTLKSAVGRNRIRRRIFEVLRLELPKLKPGHDIVLTVYSAEFATMSSRELSRQVCQLLSQAGLYK